MKKITALSIILLMLMHYAFSQNVGIGTTTPQAKLDINGDIALRSADITITTTYNYALDVNTLRQSNYRLLQSFPGIGNFILSGITTGSDGRIITLANRSGSSMEIYNDEAIAVATDRIITGTGTTFVIYNGGSVSLRYDASIQKWEVINSHYNSLDYFGGVGGTSYWDLTGSNISNTNTGNVGIKIAAPNASLSVGRGSGTDGTAAFFGTANVSHFNYGNTEDTYIRGGKNGSKVIINDGALFGNVGIGLNNPRGRLSILSNTVMGNSNTEVLQIAGKNAMAIFSDQNGSDFGYLKAVTDNTQSPQLPRAGIEVGAGGGNIYLTSLSYQPALTVNGLTNNVGIGTTTASSPLSFANVLGKKISLFNADTNNDYGLGLQNSEMQIYTPNYGKITFGFGTSGSYTGNMTYYPGSAQLGINCLPQTGYTLSVSGKIRAKEIRVNTNWADYVFADDYKLRSLKEVELYIKEHKHLPGITDAATLQADGVDVSKMQSIMMEKIEELTLYLIEANKKIEHLQKENAIILKKLNQ